MDTKHFGVLLLFLCALKTPTIHPPYTQLTLYDEVVDVHRGRVHYEGGRGHYVEAIPAAIAICSIQHINELNLSVLPHHNSTYCWHLLQNAKRRSTRIMLVGLCMDFHMQSKGPPWHSCQCQHADRCFVCYRWCCKLLLPLTQNLKTHAAPLGCHLAGCCTSRPSCTLQPRA